MSIHTWRTCGKTVQEPSYLRAQRTSWKITYPQGTKSDRIQDEFNVLALLETLILIIAQYMSLSWISH